MNPKSVLSHSGARPPARSRRSLRALPRCHICFWSHVRQSASSAILPLLFCFLIGGVWGGCCWLIALVFTPPGCQQSQTFLLIFVMEWSLAPFHGWTGFGGKIFGLIVSHLVVWSNFALDWEVDDIAPSTSSGVCFCLSAVEKCIDRQADTKSKLCAVVQSRWPHKLLLESTQQAKQNKSMNPIVSNSIHLFFFSSTFWMTKFVF